MTKVSGFRVVAGVALLVALPGVARAQASRTWVSGVGDDANPCSRTAPCKTFAGAISKTAARGEINVLDPGGYGAVTITKAITIDGGSTFASILASGTNGIVVNAGAGDQVILRNLSINGAGTGLSGIRYIQALTLYVENCVIQRFTNFGINADVTGTGFLFVNDSNIHTNPGGGILVKGNAANVRASIDTVRMHANVFGVKATGNAIVGVQRSVASSGGDAGYVADGAGAKLGVAFSTSNNNVFGVRAANGGSVAFWQSSVIGFFTAAFSQDASSTITTPNVISLTFP